MTHQQLIRRVANTIANVASDLAGKERVDEAVRLDNIAQQLRAEAGRIERETTRRIQG